MPIIKISEPAVPRKALTVRMEEPLLYTLQQYAQFIGSRTDYVIVEALKLVFKKDREFRRWLNENRTSQDARQDTTSEEINSREKLAVSAANARRVES